MMLFAEQLFSDTLFAAATGPLFAEELFAETLFATGEGPLFAEPLFAEPLFVGDEPFVPEPEFDIVAVFPAQPEIIVQERSMSTQIAATITKPPTAIRFNAVSLVEYLGDDESLTAHEVVASDPALVIDEVTTPTGLIRWRVSQGVNGQDYIVTVTVTTDVGRKEPIFIRYRVRQPKGAAT